MRDALLGRALLSSVLTAWMLVALPGAPPAAAQTGLSITTAFPAVSVQPGADVSFELTISAAEPVRADLQVEGVPDGWSAALSGGGNEIAGAFVTADEPATVTLAVDVPDAAPEGATTLVVIGRGGGDAVRLELDVIVTTAAGGSVELESDYPSLAGTADQDFSFNLTLSNDTPQQMTFGLDARGPSGWQVSVQPAGQASAASVTVDARGSQRLEVSATPPARATAGSYPIVVEVVAGEHQVVQELAVEITGTTAMRLVTGDERLSTTANAGSTRDLELVVVNEGSTPLAGIALSGDGPSEWEVAFEPASIEQLPPGESATATARITPSGDAVAGDYVVSLSADAEAVEETIEVRVTVETSPIWGFVGIVLILATLGIMVGVFRRYGRR